jgi:hypothetical protein
MLERVEAEVRQLGDVLAGCPDPEHATGVLGASVLRVEVVVEATVAPTSAGSCMAAGAEVGHVVIVRAPGSPARIDGLAEPSALTGSLRPHGAVSHSPDRAFRLGIT